jgi:hypothetical protein
MAEILLFFLTTSKAIFWADEAKLDEETGINFSLVNLNIYIIFILIIFIFIFQKRIHLKNIL